MTLSKEKSKYNGLVEAEVRGFRPNMAVTLRWPDGTVIAAGTAGGDGRATLEFRTPLVALGTYRVEARDAFGHVAVTTLAVIPRILLNEERGPTTSRLRVYFYGFAPGERVEVRWYALDEATHDVVVTVEIAPNGRGSSLVTIPRRSPVGAHKVMGRVVGVSRSASTTFAVTSEVGGAEIVDQPEATASPTASPSASPTPSPTGPLAPTVTSTPEPTPTATPSSPTATPTLVPAATSTPQPVPTSVPTATPEPIASETPDPTPTATPTVAIGPEPEATAVPEETPTP